ncbi:MAG: hypothetical protein DCF15_05890 [Phormidesmis priestleyi]|uniref:Uncharacterized protein n=1 Tax=Phormidesmis priestleyi TaxID=268141 RepID=A0A2W4XL37_9CYAN|nr:MAG: hypothetical protein DCF15_05890 [Phormidesmis priestleyi]
MKLNPHIVFSSLGLAFSLPLLFIPNVPAIFAGGMGTAGAGGYLAANVALAADTRKRQKEISDKTRQIDTREHELSSRFKSATADLNRQLNQAIAERDRTALSAKAHVTAIEAQRRHLLDEAKAAMGDELRREFEAEYQRRFEQSTADFSRRGDEFYHAEGELCDQIEVLQAVLAQNETYLREEFGKEVNARADNFAGRYQTLQGQLEKYGQVIQTASSEAIEDLRQKDLMIAKLQGQVELLNAPRKYRGNSQDDKTANKILEFFLKRSVAVEAEDWERKLNQLIVWLYPKDAALPQLQLLMDELQQSLGLYARPSVEIDRSCFKIVCDTDAKISIKATITEPPLSRLERAISEAIHVRIAAPSGSGKSVLLGNLVNYLTENYLSSYQLYDPKVTARKVWGNLTPTYYSTDCLPALFSLAKECLKRIDLCKVAAENDKPAPDFNPEFHIIDELEFMYGLVDIIGDSAYTSKKFATNVKAGLKVGREHKIKLLFVTQSALCSDVNLKKNDFFNTTSLFLGQTIMEALDSDLMSAVSTQKKAILRAEYKARLARGDKYTILVYEPEKPTEAWLCAAPSPGHYAALATASTANTAQNENTDLGGVDARTSEGAKSGESLAGQGVPQKSSGELNTPKNADSTPAALDGNSLEVLLRQGTHCPDCGHHSASYSQRQPNGLGNVRLKCKSDECSPNKRKPKTFSWQVSK